MPLTVLAVLLFVQHREPARLPPNTEQKIVTNLVAQIRRLAASEPAVYGVATRIRTAEVLTAKYPGLAKEILREAQGELSGVTAAGEQDRMRVRLVKALAPIDLEEAEHQTKAFHPGGVQDYRAEAYDQLFLFLADRPGEARQMISKGLAEGALRMVSASRLLDSLKAHDSEAATSLFAEMLAAFPADSPASGDVLYLVHETSKIVPLSRPLAFEAIDQELRAATSDSLRVYGQGGREALLRQIAALIDSVDLGVLRRYQDMHKELNLPPPKEESKPKEEKKSEDDAPDFSGLSYSEALARTRKLENVTARAGALIDISRREELTPQQRASVASEALSTVNKMPLAGDRLFGLAMISRDFARRNEPANAALAAQMLSETYAKVCDCPSMTCKHGDEELDCMQNVEDFAEYLEEFKISPDSMRLDNISLQARLLVLKLHSLVTAK